MGKVILDLCGGTGSWSKPYKDAGYDVLNITLPEYDILKTEFGNERLKYDIHFRGEQAISIRYKEVYGILSAPPCTMFSFARTNAKLPRDLESGMKIVIMCLNIIWHCQYQITNDAQRKPPLKFWALENPNGMLKWFLGKPVFEFNPYDFGDNYQKHTHIWGYFNLPEMYPIFLTPEQKELAQTNSQPLPELESTKISTQAQRSLTPLGFAKAFFEANR